MIRFLKSCSEASAFFAAVLFASTIVLSHSAGAQAASSITGLSQPVISGPLSLADAVKTARKYSPMVQAAGDRVSAAQARVGMAKAMTQPQLSSTAFGGTSAMGDIIASPPNVMPSGLFTVPDKSGVTAQAAVMYPLYTGGRNSSAVRGAKALCAASASDKVSAELNVSLETKTAYHRALLAQSTVEVYRTLVKDGEERVRIAEEEYRAGRIAKYDLLRNQTELADARQQFSNAERDAAVAVVDLKTVMGVSPASNVSLSDTLTFAVVSGTSESYLARALRDRPEIAAARARIESAHANVEVAKSAYRPQIYASAMEGVSAVSSGTDSGFTTGIIIGLPILDGGLRRSSVKEAEAMRNSMTREEQAAILGVQQDVNTVWAELQAAEQNVGLSEAAVSQAEEDYRVIRLRYESGKAVNVEVLDALSSLVRAQNNRLMALYEHSVAEDRLSRAIGEF